MTTVKFQEEFSAKIPALTLLTNLGYTFIPPSGCEALRGNTLATEKKTEQDKIAPVLANVGKEIELLKQEKKALMQQLLTGKRRVKI